MDESVRWVLEARARRFAEVPAAEAPGELVGEYAGCRVGASVLGIPVATMHEFAPLRSFTPLRGRRGLLGVTHLRGDVMALVDLLDLLAGHPAGECGWMMVLQGSGGRCAVPVGEVLGTRRVRTTDLLPPAQAPRLGPGVAAVTSDLWFLLDPDALRLALSGDVERASA